MSMQYPVGATRSCPRPAIRQLLRQANRDYRATHIIVCMDAPLILGKSRLESVEPKGDETNAVEFEPPLNALHLKNKEEQMTSASAGVTAGSATAGIPDGAIEGLR